MPNLTIGLSLSLTGAYAPMGQSAAAALRLFVADANAAGGIVVDGGRYQLALECRDDESRRERAIAIYRWLVERRPALLLGPYGSGLVRATAPLAEDAGMLFVNHGGADDNLYDHGYRMIVGVLSPAGDYMAGCVQLLSGLKFRKRVAMVTAESGFANAIATGIERACAARVARLHGVRLRVKYRGGFDPVATPALLSPIFRRNRINVLLSAGSYAHDCAVMRFASGAAQGFPVLACVAAGVQRFGADLGDQADGIVGPSQWEEAAPIKPLIGPTGTEFARRLQVAAPAVACDYPAAQAYAAGLLAIAALREADSLEPTRLRAALGGLRTTTFYGDFALDARGRQSGHRMLLVQWHRGRKVIIEPEQEDANAAIEFPSGWRLLLASLRYLRLNRPDDDDDPGNDDAGERDEDDAGEER